MTISSIRESLKLAESDLDGREDAAIAVISSNFEILIRLIITDCYQRLRSQDDVAKMKYVENEIGQDKKSYQNFGLDSLFRFWRQAKIPELWSKIPDNPQTPAVMATFPFTELIDARNMSTHHGIKPNASKLKRLFYTIMDFVDEVYPANERLIPAKVQNLEKTTASNLPRLDHDFVGRQKEIEKIIEWLSINSRTFSISITGVGGVGKSTLAIEVARRCLTGSLLPETIKWNDVSFDAVVWTSAKQKSLIGDSIHCRNAVKSNLAEIIEEILKVVWPEKCKDLPDEKKQYAYVEEILRSKRVLLIIDNMETITDENVMTFVDELPQPSKVIITDRRSVQYSRPIRLAQLSSEDAKCLVNDQFRLRDKAISDCDVEKIVLKTGGIPLAILWAIGQIDSLGISVDQLFSKMLKDKRTSKVLDFLFAESFHNISDHAKNLLAALAVPGAPVSNLLLAEWLKISIEQTDDALSELIQFALVFEFPKEKDGKTEDFEVRWYSLLPLTREYVMLNPIVDKDLRSTISEGISHHLHKDETSPDWPSIDTIDRVDSIRSLVIWAVEDAYERSDYDLVFKLVRWASYSLGVRGHHDTRLRLGRIVLCAAEHQHNDVEAARTLIGNIGWVHFIWYQFDEAKSELLKGLTFAESAGDRLLQGAAIRTLALIEKEQGFFDRSNELLQQARDIFLEIQAFHFLAITYGALGSLFRDMNNYNEAREQLNLAIETANKLNNNEEILSIFYQKLCHLMIHTGQLDDAESINRQAQQILVKLRRQVGVAYCKRNLALIAECREDISQALAYATEAWELFEVFGAKEDIAKDIKRIYATAVSFGLVNSIPEPFQSL